MKSGKRCLGAGGPGLALAVATAAGRTGLQGNAKIYASGYKTKLRDITSGGNGSCGSHRTAGPGYDLVTGLGSPINYA